MSSPDFRKGLAIPELNKELAEKAEEIQEFLKEQTNNRKSGKAETGRLAIILAHKHLTQLKQEKEDKKQELAIYLQRVDRIMEELN